MRWNWGPDADANRGRGGARVTDREHDDRVVVVANLPGVTDLDDANVRCDGEMLRIRGAAGQESSVERVGLPFRVDEESASATLNNGVLAVSFNRDD